MKVKDFKKFLAELPANADEQEIVFTTKKMKGLYVITGAIESFFHDGEVPEGITQDFILLYNGQKP